MSLVPKNFNSDYSEQANKRTEIAYKTVHGGNRSDICLHITSNFPWKSGSLFLHPHGQAFTEQLPFHVEQQYNSKKWSKASNSCAVHAWAHKSYTSVRVQFCRDYYGAKLQFTIKTGDISGATVTPIIIKQHHARVDKMAKLPTVESDVVKQPKKRKREW